MTVAAQREVITEGFLQLLQKPSDKWLNVGLNGYHGYKILYLL